MAPLSRTWLLLALLCLSSLLEANSENMWSLISQRDLGKINPSAVLHSYSFKNGTEEQVEINALFFQEKDFSLIVMDHPLQNKSLLEAIEEASCIAGVNGGYFQLDGTPLGLLVHRGKTIHPLQHAGILSGLFVNTPHGMSLLRVGEAIPTDATEVLQAGPFLFDHGHPVIGLESTKKAYRTFLATNGQGLWMMGVISPVTLAEGAQILFTLHTTPIPGLTTKFLTRALNLDGGSSSALWADTKPVPFSFRTDVCVRDFLGLTRIFHTNHLRKSGSPMDAALISKSSSGSVYAHSRRQTSSFALPHQPSRLPRYDQYEISGLKEKKEH
jgi:hypothetical protein